MGHIINSNAYIRLGYQKNGFIMDRWTNIYKKYLQEFNCGEMDFLVFLNLFF